ncbi:hypothetical protein EJK15_65525 [Nonomuraea basaltis]|nr:hypothetical protein EJK15_65525 [Nonomuraea basaltis]
MRRSGCRSFAELQGWSGPRARRPPSHECDFSITLGVPYRESRWFRGRETVSRTRSSCPGVDEADVYSSLNGAPPPAVVRIYRVHTAASYFRVRIDAARRRTLRVSGLSPNPL